jgi:hypothetical protein
MGLDMVDNDRGNLNGLTESHVIALESAANDLTITGNTRALPIHHPTNSLQLVGEVGEARPKWLER